MSDLITQFLRYLRAERGLSDKTVDAYSRDLHTFAEWLTERPATDVQRGDIQNHLSHLLAAGRSGGTAARHLACLRHFYTFLIDEEVITHNPTTNIPLAKTWKKVPKSLGRFDLETMVSSLGSSGTDIRRRAILLTLFGSGLREGELTALKLSDIDFDASALNIWNGKGGKDGIAPLNPLAVNALKEYLQKVRPHLPGSSGPYVFPGRSGGQLSRMAVYLCVRAVAESALGRTVSPHQLRHGFATSLVEGGADIRDVQVLMRHSSVDTTQIYVHIDLSFLRRIYYASHPRARIATA